MRLEHQIETSLCFKRISYQIQPSQANKKVLKSIINHNQLSVFKSTGNFSFVLLQAATGSPISPFSILLNCSWVLHFKKISPTTQSMIFTSHNFSRSHRPVHFRHKSPFVVSISFLVIWICYFGVHLLGIRLHGYGSFTWTSNWRKGLINTYIQ